MARRRERPRIEVEPDEVPENLAAGPVVELWVPREEWEHLDRGSDALNLVLALKAKRRWSAARNEWAQRRGLDGRDLNRAAPHRPPRMWRDGTLPGLNRAAGLDDGDDRRRGAVESS